MKHSLSIFLLVVAGLWNAVLPGTLPTSSVYPLHPSANSERNMLDASNKRRSSSSAMRRTRFWRS